MKRIVSIVCAALIALAGTCAATAATAVSSSCEYASAKKQKAQLRTVVFRSDIHCKNCKKKVDENIAFEKGVKALESSVEEKTIKITYDPSKTSEEALAAAIRKLGYSAEKIN